MAATTTTTTSDFLADHEYEKPQLAHQEPTSLQSMSNVSDDLLVEILIRLPDCRSAIQCRAVCKRWNSLISDNPFARSFIHRRHRSSPDHHYTLLCPTGHEIPLHETPGAEKPRPGPSFLPDDPGAKIIASCYDLLLVSPPSPARVYHIYNPVTRRRLVLPAAPAYGGAEPSGFGLVCKPAVCNKQLGCTANCEYSYRVVLFYWCESKGVVTASVFSSETLEWSKKLPRGQWSASRAGGIHGGGRVVCCGRILYWNHRTEAGRQFLVSFDAFRRRHRWRFLTVPKKTALRYHLFMGRCRGRLRICRPYRSRRLLGGVGLDVWELRHRGDAPAVRTSWRFVGRALRVPGDLYDEVEIALDPNNGDALLMSDPFNMDQQEIQKRILIKRLRRFITDHHFELYSSFPLLKPSWPTPLPDI